MAANVAERPEAAQLPAELERLCRGRRWGAAIEQIAGLRKSEPGMARELARAVFEHARAAGPAGAAVVAAIRYSVTTRWTRDII